MQRVAEPRLAFAIMSAIHDNPLRRRLSDPSRALRSAGLRPGCRALEVGCGPGFFTIPAARLVGKNGLIVALDIQPLAVRRVRQKAREAGVANVLPILAEASHTGLRDGAVDVVFLFGIVHRLDAYFGDVLTEMWRVLKEGGLLSVQVHTFVGERLVRVVEERGFELERRERRIWRFHKRFAAE